MEKFWRIVRKTLLFGAIAIVVLSLAAGLLTYYFRDDIKAMAIKEVNRNLNAKVIINGSDIDITFFSTFPDAAIEFRNFKIMEPASTASTPSTGSGAATASTGSVTEGRVLIEAKLLDFKFSPLDFINKQYHIRRILLSDAIIHLKIDENGKPNYNILKADTTKKKDTAAVPLDINLRHIRLKNVKLSYDNLQEKQHVDVKINDCIFAGNFSDAQYDLKTNLDLVAENLTIGNRQYLKNKKIVVDAALAVDNVKKKYNINSFKLKFENAFYTAKGFVMQSGKRYQTALNISGADAGIQTLFSLLPANIRDRKSVV